jgi:hypothetical protein
MFCSQQRSNANAPTVLRYKEDRAHAEKATLLRRQKKEITKMASPRVGSCMWINEPIIRACHHKHPKWPELFRSNKGENPKFQRPAVSFTRMSRRRIHGYQAKPLCFLKNPQPSQLFLARRKATVREANLLLPVSSCERD